MPPNSSCSFPVIWPATSMVRSSASAIFSPPLSGCGHASGRCTLLTSCCSCFSRRKSRARSGNSTTRCTRMNSMFTIFSSNPDVLIGQALTLRYKPVDLDVLPLYIALIAASPLILWCLLRRPNWTLLGSVLLYIGARLFDWNLASYPTGTHWYFNPFAWQLMFVFAAWCGVGGIAQLQFLIRSRLALIVALAWMAFAFLIVMTWHLPVLDAMVPKWMIKAIYPIDKTDLDMLRFTHFLALALVVTRYFPRKSEILTSKWLRPMVLCGQHSLPIFCFGVFLSFGAHWILVQHAQGGARALWMQLLVSVGGILIMIGLAWLLERAEKVPALFVETSANLPDATNKPAAA